MLLIIDLDLIFSCYLLIRVSQNCLLHSSNMLCELKDKIYCQNDDIDIGINRHYDSQSARIASNPMKVRSIIIKFIHF